MVNANHAGFWPTAETAAFVLAGSDLERRFAVQALFDPEHFFRRERMLEMDDARPAQSLFSTALTLGKEYLFRITTGSGYKPAFSRAFPATRITTEQDWDDLILPAQVLHEVEEVRAWIQHRDTLMRDWNLGKRIKPGYRSLFYGPPGTGKTLTATLLGKTTGLDVYRIDLSLLVSKWIGETEKNLSRVFDQAEINDWILFFDEADALFGKRTQTTSANDRYANQEVAYLLQRIEEYSGVAILATNLKGNIDDAFARRFQSMIFFPVPPPEERLRLWRGAFSEQVKLQASVDLEAIAEEFEITGGAIVNVLRYSTLMTLRRGADTVDLADIRQGIRREFRKDGKAL
jgi:SpoVK/Ycf46/Vps4 family AAA+-type ATPase